VDEPEVRALIDDAVALAETPFDAKRPRRLLIRAVAEKQRARRPSKRAARC
jgi:hypothetical protein